MTFDYDEAFSRNIGWVTEAEQQSLLASRVAIAGMGGVGGSHLLTLTRLGIGAFHIADFDEFELGNFNRQAGASMRHLGRPKAEVMEELARDINPQMDLVLFPGGVDSTNIDHFLDGVDLYVDALDFFVLETRSELFAACAEKGIPAITAAPLGMGAALLCFMPGKMSFEEYFRFAGQSEDEKALRFMLGLSPALLQMPYLADDTRVDFNARRGPSTPMACELCAGFAGTYALKILLGRGQVLTAPRGVHFDAYRNKVATTWRPWGNRNPIQQLGLAIARKRVMAKEGAVAAGEPRATAVERILDLARWAPSGDNESPWRFEILGGDHFVVHARDTRDWCIYDLDGTSSQIALGALLENIAIAASGEGMTAAFMRRSDAAETEPLIDVRLSPADGGRPDPLISAIRSRVTQRFPFTTRSLSLAQKQAMEEAVGEGYRVIWLEGAGNRWRMAKLLFHNAHIRLTTPEAYEVHRQNIEWGARFSEDRLPEYAVGLSFPTRKVMRWVLGSWDRVRFFNRFFAGTWIPRLQMDLLAGYRCGAHFAIVADRALESIDDYIDGGRAMQRFWLEATRQGLQFQPEMTPVIFSRYIANALSFTSVESESRLAARLAEDLAHILGDEDACKRVYMGRVGYGPAPTSRSIRPPLEQLIYSGEQ